MRNLNILSEEYIDLESLLGNYESKYNSDLYDLRLKINEAVSAYYNSNQENSDFVQLRYSPIFESLTKYDYQTGLRNFAKVLTESDNIPLESGFRLSYILNGSKRKLTESFLAFGSCDNIDIHNDKDFSLSYNRNGKFAALNQVSKLYETVESAFSKLSSTDPLLLSEGLNKLAEIYYLLGE